MFFSFSKHTVISCILLFSFTGNIFQWTYWNEDIYNTTLTTDEIFENMIQQHENTIFQGEIFPSMESPIILGNWSEKSIEQDATKKRARTLKNTIIQNRTSDFWSGIISAEIEKDTQIISQTNSFQVSSFWIHEATKIKKEQAKSTFSSKQKNIPIKKRKDILTSKTFEFWLTDTHLTFSKPVKITLPAENLIDGSSVEILVQHIGENTYGSSSIASLPISGCSDGTATLKNNIVTVQSGMVVFYTCGASTFTMNPTGWILWSWDLRLVIGDCGQFQLYYNGTPNFYTGNPPATTGCNQSLDSWIALRIWGSIYCSYWACASTRWSTNTTVWSQIGNTYSWTTNLTRVVGGRTYQVILAWKYTAPNKFFTIDYSIVIPTGNTNNIRFYIGWDTTVGWWDGNDVGFSWSAPTSTFWVYDSVLNQLSAIRYVSWALWNGAQSNNYTTIRNVINGGTDFNNTIVANADLGFWVNWNFGTAPGTRTGSLEWRLLPFVATAVPDVIVGIGQPVPNLQVGITSNLPVIVTNAGNTSSTGLHTVVMSIPNTIIWPANPFSDNGWSCWAQIGTGVTCTKTTTITSLWNDTVNIPVIPLPAANGTTVRFNAYISNINDSNLTNNSAFVDLQVTVAPAPPDTIPPTIDTTSINSGALFPNGNIQLSYTYSDNVWWSGINANSANFTLYKWNAASGTYGWDISPSYETLLERTVTGATFQLINLPYGKYEVIMYVSDIVGNIALRKVTFYIDEIEFIVSSGSIYIDTTDTDTTILSDEELYITVKTVWAAFNITMNKSGNIMANGTPILDWDGMYGFWYEQYNGIGYTNSLSNLTPNTILWSQGNSNHPDGMKYTYVYRVKYGTKIDDIQSSWFYSGDLSFNIVANY